MVINIGSPNRPEIAAHVLEPFLKQAGIDRINALLVTQVDDAATNAAADLLDRYRPVYCTAADLDQHTDLPILVPRQRAARRHHPHALHAGDCLTLGDSLRCDILSLAARVAASRPAAGAERHDSSFPLALRPCC